jgi:hypothetical protein
LSSQVGITEAIGAECSVTAQKTAHPFPELS